MVRQMGGRGPIMILALTSTIMATPHLPTKLQETAQELQVKAAQWSGASMGDIDVNWNANFQAYNPLNQNPAMVAVNNAVSAGNAEIAAFKARMENVAEAIGSVATLVDDATKSRYKPGGLLSQWKRKVRTSTRKIDAAADGAVSDAEEIQDNYNMSSQLNLMRMNMTMNEFIATLDARLPALEGTLSTNARRMLETMRSNWASLMVPSGAVGSETQTLSAQVDDMQAQALEMLGGTQKEIQQLYLQVVGEMNNMKQNVGKARREMISEADKKLQKGMQDINKARRKYERKARTLQRKSEKGMASVKEKWKKKVKGMGKSFDDVRSELQDEAQELERRAFQISSKGEKLDSANPGAETEAVLGDSNSEVEDAGRLGREEGKAEKTLSKKSVADASRMLVGTADTVEPIVVSVARKDANKMAEELDSWVTIGEKDEYELEQNLERVLKDIKKKWVKLGEDLDEKEGTASSQAYKLKATMDNMKANMEQAGGDLENRTKKLNNSIATELTKLADYINATEFRAKAAQDSVHKQGISIQEAAEIDMKQEIGTLKFKSVAEVEDMLEKLDVEIEGLKPVQGEVENNRSAVEQILNHISQVSIPDMMTKIQKFGNRARHKAIQEEGNVKSQLRGLQEEIRTGNKGTEDTFMEELSKFSKEHDTKEEAWQDDQDKLTSKLGMRLDKIAEDFEANRKDLRAKRWDAERVGKKQKRTLKTLAKDTRSDINALKVKMSQVQQKAADAHAASMKLSGSLRDTLLVNADRAIGPISGELERKLAEDVKKNEEDFKDLSDKQLRDTQTAVDEAQEVADTADATIRRFHETMDRTKTDFSHAELASSSLASSLYAKVESQEKDLQGAVAAAGSARAKEMKELKKTGFGLQNQFTSDMDAASSDADKSISNVQSVAQSAESKTGQGVFGIAQLMNEVEGDYSNAKKQVDGLNADTKRFSDETTTASNDAKSDAKTLADDGSAANGDVKSEDTAMKVAQGKAVGAAGAQLSSAVSAAEVMASITNGLPKAFMGMVNATDQKWMDSVNALTAHADAYFGDSGKFVSGLRSQGAEAREAAASLGDLLNQTKAEMSAAVEEKKAHMDAIAKGMDDKIEEEEKSMLGDMHQVSHESGITAGQVANGTEKLALQLEGVLKEMQGMMELVPVRLHTHKKGIETIMNMEADTDTQVVGTVQQAVDMLEAGGGERSAWLHRLRAGQRAFKKIVGGKLNELGADTTALEDAEHRAAASMGNALQSSENAAMREAGQEIDGAKKEMNSKVADIYSKADDEIAKILADESKTQAERDALIADVTAKARAAATETMAREAQMRQEEAQLEESMARYEELLASKKHALQEKIRSGMLSPKAAELHDSFSKVSVQLERIRKKADLHARRTGQAAAIQSRLPASELQLRDSGMQWQQLRSIQELNSQLEDQDNQLQTKLESLERAHQI